MKLGFNDLIEAYNEFKFIQSTYKGEKTDWYEVHLKLYNIILNVKDAITDLKAFQEKRYRNL